MPSAAWGCVAQGGGSLCMGAALALGLSDTHLHCLWSAGRSRGAVVGDARLRAVVLPLEGLVWVSILWSASATEHM